jgi:putative ABC transport system ATP-binding protein
LSWASSEPEGTPPLLCLDAADRQYRSPAAVTALAPTTLTIDAREYVAVQGASGSGTSTLLNLLGLLDLPTSGSYRIRGIDAGRLNEAERTLLRSRMFGFVFQAFHLISGRTALENVSLGLLYAGIPRADRTAAAAALLERFGLAHRMNSAVETMSGGEQQRTAVARAIVGRPTVLLCDEPTGNLDSRNAAAVIGLLDELAQAGQTIVIATHDDTVADHAHRWLRISDGVVR